jgi:UDPglucose 6-dehydrogenase
MNNNITILGVGKLGLGFSLLLEKNGFNVLGVDIFEDYINQLNNKNFLSYEPYYNELLKNSKNINFSTSLENGLDFSDNIFIMVQTPLSGNNKFYDHTILSNLLIKINKLKPKNKNIFIQCTVMPKYIKEVGIELLNNCENCTINYNPEFIAQGSVIQDFQNPDIILVGTNNPEKIEPIIKNIYNSFIKKETKYVIVSPTEAEIIKIGTNSLITMKITAANIISDLCSNLNINKEKVLDGIGSDSRIGTKYFKSGNSYGGPCFPRDTKAMKQILDNENINSDLFFSVSNYNDIHIEFQVNELLKENVDEYIITNICYKDNSFVPIIEESAQIKKALLLVKNNKKVIIKDKEHMINEVRKEYGNIFIYKIV